MSDSVKRRETFYLAGFDPRGARHYYNLYKKESAIQSKINAMDIKVLRRSKISTYLQSWQVISDNTVTNYNYFVWDDLIKKSWIKDIFSLFGVFFYFCKYYILTGTLFTIIKKSPQQILILLYPALYFVLSILITLFTWYYLNIIINQYMYVLISMILASIPSYFLWKLLLGYGEKLSVSWLLSDYVFAARYVLDENTEFSIRLDIFADYIIEKLKISDIDEVQLIAHSIGVAYLMPILKKVLISPELTSEQLQKISILTLGEFVPLVLFLKKATKLREDMEFISHNKHFFWLDVTSAADGISFSLDYFKSISLKVEFRQIFLSPRFHLLYENKRYKKLKRNQFLFHFLYMMSTDKNGTYDFFKMTAGSQPLSSMNFTEKDLYAYEK